MSPSHEGFYYHFLSLTIMAQLFISQPTAPCIAFYYMTWSIGSCLSVSDPRARHPIVRRFELGTRIFQPNYIHQKNLLLQTRRISDSACRCP